MINLQLTPSQFRYLQDAVKRDLENLEEMEAWEIDDQIEAWKSDVKFCKAMIVMLGRVEQEQVVPH